MTRRHHIRWGHIAAISLSLGVAIFGSWYKRMVSPDGLLAEAGLMGLIAYLFCQIWLNAETELAIETLNERIDRLEGLISDDEEDEVI